MMDVVMMIIDTMRFDCIGYQSEKRHLHKYDVYKYLETPTLDSLAEKGICFTNAFCTSTLTCPSISSILTGLHLSRHGVRVHGVDKLHNSVLTLPEILRAAGYESVLYTDDGILFDIPDLTKRFDHVLYSDNLFFGGQSMNDVFKNAESGNEKTLMSLISRIKAGDKPVFLVYHVMDVHSPYLYSDYAVHKGYNMEYLQEMEKLAVKHNIKLEKKEQWKLWLDIAGKINYNIEDLFPLYVKGVSKFDKNRLKNFMDNLTKVIDADRNLFIILSDHGEGRCDDSVKTFFNHGGVLRDEVVRVPLIFIHPDFNHKLIDNMVSTVDIIPTILSLINVNPDLEYSFDGEGLFRTHPYIYCEQWINDSTDPLSVKEAGYFQRCIRTRDKKYTLYGRPENAYLDPGYYLKSEERQDFVRNLVKDLFYNLRPFKEIKAHYPEVMDETMTREELYALLLNRHRQFGKKYEIYDMNDDFFEDNPTDPFAGANLPFDSSIFLNKIISISNMPLGIGGSKNPESEPRNRRTTSGLEENVKALEQEKIMQRFRELGYL